MNETTTKDTTRMPEVVEVEPAGLAVREAGIPAPAATIDRLAELDQGLAIMKRMEELQRMLTHTLIRVTEPEDWVRSKTRDGVVSAMPTRAANLKMARFIGLKLTGVDGLELKADPVTRGENDSIKGFEVPFRWECPKLGISGTDVSVRWEDEDFTGRQVDSNDKLTFRGERALSSDLRASALSAALNRAVKAATGLGKVSDSLLEQAWGPGKLQRCQLGHGFGSAQERTAGKVADPGIAEKAEGLRSELLKRTGGDEGAAAQLLVDCTKTEKFKGHKSTKTLTEGWQIENAWKALRVHPVFGDQTQQVPTERAPGEEG